MNNIILTGFSGTGKTQVGRAVARLLGWEFLDTDEEVVRRAGKPIARIFAEEGEASFRALEGTVLQEACAGDRRVIATGGGAIMDPANQALMEARGLLVCLEARAETIHTRLGGPQRSPEEEVRPLLEGPERLERVQLLKGRRQAAYARAHWTVHTDRLPLEEVAQEVVRAWQYLSGRGPGEPVPFAGDADLAAVVETSSRPYPVLVGWDLLSRIGEILGKAPIADPVYLVSDSRVFEHYGRPVQQALQEAEIPCHTFVFPAGETSKSLELASSLYGWLAERRAQRGHTLLALGGGVVTDLVGFVAATYNRGMHLVHLPTSLTAMVDAAIGGKTAVNLPQAKNLVGAFYQPRLVVADVATLKTLPQRELLEGWAEAIKHALILDADLFHTFEEGTELLLALAPEPTTQVIRRSVAIKAHVVSQDERETTGYRTLLNYGHTIGHALEAGTGYGRFLHGEAVAVGMVGAAHIGQRLGVTPPEVVERQDALLRRFQLPVRCPGVDLGTVEEAMALDKKALGPSLRWVLLESLGHAVVRADVPASLAHEVLAELAR
ncbi:MAG: 3-dehydroquinate synthase [Chloroflexi bacterium]|nr:3-dehydroquinate synthase [Chloroflexota bacterium]